MEVEEFINTGLIKMNLESSEKNDVIKELIDFESETLKATFDTLVAKEILYLNSFS